eukprot:355053-Chlamydomonas_euryale.AAC.6
MGLKHILLASAAVPWACNCTPAGGWAHTASPATFAERQRTRTHGPRGPTELRQSRIRFTHLFDRSGYSLRRVVFRELDGTRCRQLVGDTLHLGWRWRANGGSAVNTTSCPSQQRVHSRAKSLYLEQAEWSKGVFGGMGEEGIGRPTRPTARCASRTLSWRRSEGMKCCTVRSIGMGQADKTCGRSPLLRSGWLRSRGRRCE